MELVDGRTEGWRRLDRDAVQFNGRRNKISKCKDRPTRPTNIQVVLYAKPLNDQKHNYFGSIATLVCRDDKSYNLAIEIECRTCEKSYVVDSNYVLPISLCTRAFVRMRMPGRQKTMELIEHQ